MTYEKCAVCGLFFNIRNIFQTMRIPKRLRPSYHIEESEFPSMCGNCDSHYACTSVEERNEEALEDLEFRKMLVQCPECDFWHLPDETCPFCEEIKDVIDTRRG